MVLELGPRMGRALLQSTGDKREKDMIGRELAQALREGKRVYGTLIVSTSPKVVPVMQSSGLDFVFIDTEHIPIDRATLAWMCQAYRAAGLPPLVRIPNHDPYEACKVLDGGACGIIAPYIETAEQVQRLRGAVKLRPLKGKRLEEALGQTGALEPALEVYLEDNNADNLLIANIESVPGLENLDEILAVPGLDAVLIGPHDLSCSLGIPEQYRHPRFDQAVRSILTKARAAGVGAGLHYWFGFEQEIAWYKETGANLVLHAGDLNVFGQALHSEYLELRHALGDAPDIIEDEHDIIV